MRVPLSVRKSFLMLMTRLSTTELDINRVAAFSPPEHVFVNRDG
jgi:hypothetical protein